MMPHADADTMRILRRHMMPCAISAMLMPRASRHAAAALLIFSLFAALFFAMIFRFLRLILLP